MVTRVPLSSVIEIIARYYSRVRTESPISELSYSHGSSWAELSLMSHIVVKEVWNHPIHNPLPYFIEAFLCYNATTSLRPQYSAMHWSNTC